MARFRVRRTFKFADLLDDVRPTAATMREEGERLAVADRESHALGQGREQQELRTLQPGLQKSKGHGGTALSICTIPIRCSQTSALCK